MSASGEVRHPHIVIRYMACAYGRIEVALRDGPPAPDNGCKVIAVDASAPARGEALSAEARTAVIDATLALVRQSGMRCCAVFGPADVVYCEADGRTVHAAEPPSGGIRYDRVVNTVTAPDAAEEGH